MLDGGKSAVSSGVVSAFVGVSTIGGVSVAGVMVRSASFGACDGDSLGLLLGLSLGDSLGASLCGVDSGVRGGVPSGVGSGVPPAGVVGGV